MRNRSGPTGALRKECDRPYDAARVRATYALRHLVIPGVRLRFSDLGRAAHMSEMQGGFRGVGIGRVLAEEDVEIGDVPLIALRVLDRACHQFRDHLLVVAQVLGSRQDFDRLGPIGVVARDQPDRGRISDLVAARTVFGLSATNAAVIQKTFSALLFQIS